MDERIQEAGQELRGVELHAELRQIGRTNGSKESAERCMLSACNTLEVGSCPTRFRNPPLNATASRANNLSYS